MDKTLFAAALQGVLAGNPDISPESAVDLAFRTAERLEDFIRPEYLIIENKSESEDKKDEFIGDGD